jgi:hypothetical protein
MKKINLLLIFLNILLCFQLTAAVEIPLDTFPDFPYFKGDSFPDEEAFQKLHKTGKTLYQFFGVEAFGWGTDTLEDFERVEEDGRILSFRRFFPKSKVIAEEYTRFKIDTFIYVRYSEKEHRVEARGKVVPTICCQHIDTIPYMDPITFKPAYSLVRTMDWSKEGFWQELVNNRSENGEYLNNQRSGHWHSFDRSTKKLSHHQYVAGKIISNTLDNALEANDKILISKALQGTWYFNTGRANDTLFYLQRTSGYTSTYSHFQFNGEQVVIQVVSHHGGPRYEGRMTLDDKNQLRFDIKAFQNKVFQIKYLGRYQMEWELLSK